MAVDFELIRIADPPPLPPNVVIGRGCRIELTRATFASYRSVRDPGVRLGNRVEVYCWTAFGAYPGGLIEVGDDSVLVGASIMCAERVTIGKRVVVSYNVVIADSDFHPVDPELRWADAIAVAPGATSERPRIVSKPVVIEDDAWVGIGAIILKGVRIGAGARIAPGSVVTASVSAGAGA